MSHLKIAVVAATILLATTACGGSPEGAAATDQPTVDPAPQSFQQGGPVGRGLPGAGGKIAAVDGTTLQVQSVMGGQVAVTFDADTDFTEQVAVDASALKVGDCVMVLGEGEGTVAATSVMVTTPGDDGCMPSRPEGAPAGAPDQPPPGMGSEGAAPGELPDGAVMMRGAFGEVTAVSKTGFTVETTPPGSDESSSQRVTTSADTTWQATVVSTSKAVEVGRCAVAQGDRDDTGAISATSIAISDAVGGECLAGGLVRMEAQG